MNKNKQAKQKHILRLKTEKKNMFKNAEEIHVFLSVKSGDGEN